MEIFLDRSVQSSSSLEFFSTVLHSQNPSGSHHLPSSLKASEKFLLYYILDFTHANYVHTMPSINPFLCVKAVFWPGEWVQIARRAKYRRERKKMNLEKPEFKDYEIVFDPHTKTWTTSLRSAGNSTNTSRSNSTHSSAEHISG